MASINDVVERDCYRLLLLRADNAITTHIQVFAIGMLDIDFSWSEHYLSPIKYVQNKILWCPTENLLDGG